MLLAIDIGNTNITLGVFKNGRENNKPGRTRLSAFTPSASTLVRSWRLATSTLTTADEYGTKILDFLQYAAIQRIDLRTVAVASVVPALNPVFEEFAQKYFGLKPFFIDEKAKLPVVNLYENPKEVGADRLVNASAGFTRFGGPIVIVDFGTATTFDCVSKKGEYLGGLIVPGPVLAAESLSLRTAKLPKVDIAKPSRIIGRNAVESIRSGLYFGYVSLVDGILERLSAELGRGMKMIATGGLAPLIAGGSRFIKKESVFPELTLEGIRLICEKNL